MAQAPQVPLARREHIYAHVKNAYLRLRHAKAVAATRRLINLRTLKGRASALMAAFSLGTTDLRHRPRIVRILKTA